MKDAGIIYWATAGTLLGLERHGTAIPWDDDIDVSVREEDTEKINTVLDRICTAYPEYKYREFSWDELTCGWKIGVYIKNLHQFDMDIFRTKRMITNGINVYNINLRNDPHIHRFWKNEYYAVSDIFLDDGSLLEKPFGYGHIYTLKNPVDYLNRTYNNWKSVAIVQNHKDGYLDKRPYIMTTENLSEINKWLCSFDKSL